ncbi:MAG: single-stranded DNA-binding protein, partial [Syntrophomonadaceae bacterium]|nr:single-stranded DNA-binding protein [Syntrophomonadaceae bacterium]
AVEGRLQVRTYEAKDGQKRWVTEVIAEDVRFLDKGGTSSGGGSEHQAKPRQDDWNDLGREVSLEDIDIVDPGAEDDEVPF